MWRHWLLALVLLASACGPELSPAQKAAEDAKAVAMVEAAQDRHPPLRPLAPQPLTAQDIERGQLFGAGCGFEPAGGTQPILLARAKRAVMKLEQRPTSFASDPGGVQLPLGTWEHYVGKGLSLRIAKAEGNGLGGGDEAMQWPARLTVRDQYDRIVYVGEGTLRCGG